MHLQESIRGILKEQRHDDILREAFLYDVRRLEEAREYSQALLSEGVISENIDDRHLLDEGIFDTIKALGKNVTTGAIAGAKDIATRATASVKSAVNKAQAQGNEAEAVRIQTQIAQLQSRLSQLTGKPIPAAAPASAVKRPGRPSAKTAPVKAAPAKPAPLPTAARGAMAKTEIGATKTVAANKPVVNQAASEVVAKMAKDDPKQLVHLQGLAQTDPTKLAAEYNAALKQNSAEVKSELVNTPETKGKPGLLGKVGAWAKNNPVKAGLGLAALGAIGTAAAIGSGGIIPLLTTALLGAGKGAAAGAVTGAVKGAVGQGIANKQAGGKFFGNLKQMGSAALKSAGKGAKIGAALGAGGAVAGKALAGVSKIAGGLSGASGNHLPQDTNDPDDIMARQLQAKADRMQAQHPEGWNADNTEYHMSKAVKYNWQASVANASAQELGLGDHVAAYNTDKLGRVISVLDPKTREFINLSKDMISAQDQLLK